ncbi:MAG: xylan 1,4-beta-xylosidase [Defluviitaleaceae bacterium]|nr:xylan 1,4-beta-xylosidase [Defluviitaleaceae bacterium]
MKKITKENAAPFNDNFRYCIGTGRLGLALRKEYLDGLKKAVDDIGFKYIRGHGLFHDDIGIYREYEWEGDTKILYNFTYIDQIFDSFLEIGIKPFIELGFMPEQLASGKETVFWWKGNITPPKCYDKWAALVKATINHFIERYGLEEVLTWPIEVWNEPNLTNFWKDADQDEYFKLYKVTVKTIKKIDERLQVGGPSICGGGEAWMPAFLTFCEKEGLPVDFLSRHAYTTSPAQLVPFSCYQDMKEGDPLLIDFKSGREVLEKSKFKNIPVHITEFNTSYKPINPIHDTAYNAAYLGKILAFGGDYVDSFSYWTFSDVFEEEDIPKTLFHGGFGLLAYNLIKKPTYYLYEFFAKLKGDTLYKDENMIVVQGDKKLYILAFNPVEDTANKTLYETLDLPIEAETAFIKRSVVNEEYGNAWNAWRKMGRPRFPSKEQIKDIKEAGSPKIEIYNLPVKEGFITLEFVLQKNEITLFEISPIHKTAGPHEKPYYGLDDSRIISYNKLSHDK